MNSVLRRLLGRPEAARPTDVPAAEPKAVADRLLRQGAPLRLHLGSGPYQFPGWVNLDLDSPQADIRMDLRDPLPFPDGSVHFVFAEHFIEHVTREEGITLLRECGRVLAEDGVIRLSTPDLKWLAEVYLKGELHHWDPLWRPATACRMVNEGMRLWGHQFLYDRDELRDVLREAGFLAQRDVAWRESSLPELRNLEQRPFFREIIVEAAKRPDSFT